jgi:L-ascorbate metabolism protein UlaG (beta-lactamase superfamily)
VVDHGVVRALRALRLALIGASLASCGSTHEGLQTPHFDGRNFSNPGQPKESSVTGYLCLRLTTSQAPWPDAVPLPPTAPPPPQRVDDGSARVTWVGHASVLIQVAGLNILTDPMWSQRASPLSFAGPKRVTPPGIAFDALPPIDVVLISHNHFDHLDLPTLRQLDARDRPRVIVPLGNLDIVRQAMPASRVSEHDWGAAVPVGQGAVVHVEPMLHASGRSPFDQQRSLWAAYVVEARALKIYFAGDSGYGDGRTFKATGARFGPVDLAILPIGAYAPESFMADSHMSPVDALRAKADLRAARALAHHFGAFQLGFEAFDAPPKALQAALASANTPVDSFAVLQPGQAITVEQERR